MHDPRTGLTTMKWPAGAVAVLVMTAAMMGCAGHDRAGGPARTAAASAVAGPGPATGLLPAVHPPRTLIVEDPATGTVIWTGPLLPTGGRLLIIDPATGGVLAHVPARAPAGGPLSPGASGL
jgi:hypothetical protein